MEKIKIYNLDAKEKEVINKPKVFSVRPRKDLVLKAIEAFQSRNKQAQGRDPTCHHPMDGDEKVSVLLQYAGIHRTVRS